MMTVALTTSLVDGLTKAASTENMNRTNPARLIAEIHELMSVRRRY